MTATQDSHDGAGRDGPSVPETHAWILQPPPRSRDAVSALAAPMRRRASTAWKVTLVLFVVGVVGAYFAPPSRANSSLNLIMPACIMSIFASVIAGMMALYYRSHRVIFEQLVRDSVLLSGEVDSVWKGARGIEGMRVKFMDNQGRALKLVPEGQPFMQLCREGQTLPVLLEPRRFAAVLCPNGELALGKWRKDRSR